MGKGGHNEANFKAAILGLSVSNNWDEAKSEWQLDFVYIDNSDRACECGHSPIHQICCIKNQKNSATTEVGNVCVKRFLRLLSNRIFSVLKRLQANNQKSLNPASLDLFRDRGVISYQEALDYREYWRKRTTLTDKQKMQKKDINLRILTYFAKESATLISKAYNAGIKSSHSQQLPPPKSAI
ncbi:hypothetical protein [Sphingomonas sp. Leaf23]|uniref:hypothetical protein n=1 Tax=Sphingomonas sp. Leaf23 TaxID=1735689 RepID=UPI0012E19C43|nr:hypothetical protein [Sphingomonas sp. Leaf23]